jgi:microcystin-dependent protein
MAIDYVGALKIFAGNFAPKGYALAQGGLLSIQQNTALFSLYGTFYGGNGISNFQLPDLRGRLPLGQGTGPGLSTYTIGQIGGVENVSLLSGDVPPHNHIFYATTGAANTKTASSTVQLAAPANADKFYAIANNPGVVPTPLNHNAITNQGGSQPHNNIQPSMGLTYIVALQGVFPSQN